MIFMLFYHWKKSLPSIGKDDKLIIYLSGLTYICALELFFMLTYTYHAYMHMKYDQLM